MSPDNEKNFPRDTETKEVLKNKEDSRKESLGTLESGVNAKFVEKTAERIAHEGDQLRKKEIKKAENLIEQHNVYLRLNSRVSALQVLDMVFDSVKKSETISIADKENILLQLVAKYKASGESQKSKEALMLASDLSEKNVYHDERLTDARVANHVYGYTGGDTELALKTRERNKEREEMERQEKEQGDQHNIAA